MAGHELVAGIDSSTQSTKVLLMRTSDGSVVAQASAPHRDGTEIDPAQWWDALQQAGSGLLDRAAAIAVAGQQHGMVALDGAGEPVRPALLWNDLRSAPQAAEVVAHFGGAAACAAAIGTVPTAAITVTKLRWLAQHEPETATRVDAVLLPHDYLTWRLGDRRQMTTDHGDASGTGYYSPARRSWLPEVAAWALGRTEPPALPALAAPGDVVGRTRGGALLAAGTGDNMAAALGLGIEGGDVVVSIGTSGTAFTVARHASADPLGYVCGFANASGGYLPLVCTINAARMMTTTAALLGVELTEFSDLALAAEPGAGGVTFLPYLDGERTPNRPDASGVLHGITSRTTRAEVARAAVEGLLCSLADAVDALGTADAADAAGTPGTRPQRILLIGGGARSEAVCRIAPSIFGMPIEVPEPGEYVARGAARQAAWALSGAEDPPDWPAPPCAEFDGPSAPHIRQRYGALRDRTEGW